MVSPSAVAAAGFSRPRRVCLEESIDADGDPIYYVWVGFPNAMPVEKLTRKSLGGLADWISDTLWKASHYERFPHVRIRREADFPPYLKKLPHA